HEAAANGLDQYVLGHEGRGDFVRFRHALLRWNCAQSDDRVRVDLLVCSIAVRVLGASERVCRWGARSRRIDALLAGEVSATEAPTLSGVFRQNPSSTRR